MPVASVLLAGPTRHGVRLHAQALARHTPGVPMVEAGSDALPDGPVHVHFTDRIFGPHALAAADRLGGLVGGRPLTATLHDLPQPSDGPVEAQRQQGYARVVALARGVQVSSEHERRLLEQLWAAYGVGTPPPVVVVPLPVDRPRTFGPRPTTGDVMVMGFIYPGKGHHETLAALSGLPASTGLVAVGTPSLGHDDLLVELGRAAEADGRRFSCTGYVDDAELLRWALSAGVPVSAHTHISASGSINRWIGAGRRPVVMRGTYVTELAARVPWAVTVTDDLPAAIRAALADPASTWIAERDWDDAALPDTAGAAQLQAQAIRAALEGAS